MKHAVFLAGLMGLYAAGSTAIELNTEAMKKMQEEGHKIVEQETATRQFKLPNGQCLQAAGAPNKAGIKLVSRPCNDKAANQQWQFDNAGRLVSQGGLCVGIGGKGEEPGANAVLQGCNKSDGQQWKVDGARRLQNGTGLCLQAQGGDAVTAACSGSPGQKWG